MFQRQRVFAVGRPVNGFFEVRIHVEGKVRARFRRRLDIPRAAEEAWEDAEAWARKRGVSALKRLMPKMMQQ